MEKRENNSSAVPMLRFGPMVWLKKKNTNAGDGLDFNLMQATQMCAGDAVSTLFIPPLPFHLHTYDVRAADVVYD